MQLVPISIKMAKIILDINMLCISILKNKDREMIGNFDKVIMEWG
jgi:hypothetical protein